MNNNGCTVYGWITAVNNIGCTVYGWITALNNIGCTLYGWITAFRAQRCLGQFHLKMYSGIKKNCEGNCGCGGHIGLLHGTS